VVVAEYVDNGVSGAKGRRERPKFDALLNGVARREFDMIAAWSVDRLGRSLQDLLAFLMELQAKRVDLYLHQQALDTSTPMGKAMFQLCGVFAELEHSIIQERVRAGLERVRRERLWGALDPTPKSRRRFANSRQRVWVRGKSPGRSASA
jgi:DNA invertase Pin-like site-specific DNA recombinase